MDYNKLNRSHAYIAFSSGNTWISKMIKWFTKSRFSHSFILYWDERYQTWLAIGDNFNGFCATPAKTEHTLAVADISPLDLNRGLRKNVDELGSGYGYGTLVGMVWVLIGRMFHKKWHNPFVSKTNWICSEICTHIAQDSGWVSDLVSSDTDPKALFTALEADPNVAIVENV